jgi:hypothetical protein
MSHAITTRCVKCGATVPNAWARMCRACRATYNREYKRIKNLDRSGPLVYTKIVCAKCGERTIARTVDAGTLAGWRDVDMDAKTGVCRDCARVKA